MTRKTKIVIAVAVAVAVALAIVFWPDEDEGAVTVTYTGLFANETHRASFAITNSVKAPREYFRAIAVNQDGLWQGRLGLLVDKRWTIPALSGETFDVTVFPTNQWRIYIVSAASLTPSLPDRIRARLVLFFFGLRPPRAVEWLHPPERSKTTYCPIMLGNKPVAAAEK